MGASPARIIKLLAGNMILWIAIASLIAFPLIYYGMNQWLQNFAYKISIHPWMLVISSVVSIVVALLTTGILTMRAANTNPAETLRDE
jgi:putative ABC transport system permease protein